MSQDSAAYTLASSWASIDEILAAHRGNLRLDLGCGYAKPMGFIGLDNLVGERTQIRKEANAPDILIDLNSQPLPFEDESCVEVRASHFLEHSHLDHIIDEVHRVLRPDGVFVFVVPYANSAEGMYPGHNIFLTEKFFHRNMNFQSKFEIIEERFTKSEDYARLPLILRVVVPFSWARIFLFNACIEMTIVARPSKNAADL